jgi:hypothetical protein
MELEWSQVTITVAIFGQLYQPYLTDCDDDDCGAINRINEWQGKPKYSDKTCPSSTLSTTNPT